MKFRIISIFSILVLSISVFSCTDDLLYDPAEIGDGESAIIAEISFTPLVATLSRSVQGGESGDAIRDMNSICVLVYKQNGELFNKYYFDSSQYTLQPNTDNPSDTPGSASSDGQHRAEEETVKATVKIKNLPYGYYRMYAVANVPASELSDAVVADIENVRNISLQWNLGNVAANSQMFGYFSDDNKSAGFEAPVLAVNRPDMTLQAWIKRAASKVTVAFDGTLLKDGVEIFIKSVKIKDIPENCFLGKDNPFNPDIADETGSDVSEHEVKLISDPGQEMTYYPDGIDDKSTIEASQYTESWPGYVSNKHPINGYDQTVVNNQDITDAEKLTRLHSENIKALYFYENLQGKGTKGTPTDKRQQVTEGHKVQGIVSYPGGIDPTNIAWKDAKRYGSYIEVQAYYKSNNTTEGEGPITYRFMLGKDAHLDYNAERNHHYKLTLRFNGWANDVDWHIDYRKDKPKLRFPHPFYISYLYGQNSMIPLEFDAPKDVAITKITAKIEHNHWWPMDCDYSASLSLNKTDLNSVIASQPDNTYYDEYFRYVQNAEIDHDVWNGFLSLKKPKNLLVLPEPNPLLDFSIPSQLNRVHFETSGLGFREYSGDEVKISTTPYYGAADDDKMHVSWDNGTYYVKVPIWTRARQMITRTGYTGSNPYNAYYREAAVNVKVELSDGTVLDSRNPDDVGKLPSAYNNIQVKQVRRLVNPTGVYRSKSNSSSFHVVLKVLKSDDDVNFTDLKSDGPWRAYVIADTEANSNTGEGGFVSLSTDVPTTTTSNYTFEYRNKVRTRKALEGLGGSKMDFYIDFKGTAVKPRYAIVRVEYNYCSCYHLIFIRQGYEADDTFGDGRKWCAGNNITQNEVATNPLDEGSLFRFGNWTGIKSESNVNKFTTRLVTPNTFSANVGTNLKLTDGTTKNFSQIDWSDPNGNTFPKPAGRRVATLADYYSLAPKPDQLGDDTFVENFHIKTGYGVCYGDGATATATSVADAFGYNEGGAASVKGMRGCFAYDVETGANLFFPLGNSGYGHRKASLNSLQGVLRYSSAPRWGYFDAVTTDQSKNYGIYKFGVFDAPLFFDVFRSNGAIYWIDTQTTGTDDDGSQRGFVGWDINYSTYDFKGITRNNVYGDSGADACFVRCIEE